MLEGTGQFQGYVIVDGQQFGGDGRFLCKTPEAAWERATKAALEFFVQIELALCKRKHEIKPTLFTKYILVVEELAQDTDAFPKVTNLHLSPPTVIREKRQLLEHLNLLANDPSQSTQYQPLEQFI